MKREDKVREMTSYLKEKAKDIKGLTVLEGTEKYDIMVYVTYLEDRKKPTMKQKELIKRLRNVRYPKGTWGVQIHMLSREMASFIIASSIELMNTTTNFVLQLREWTPAVDTGEPNPTLPLNED